MSALIPKEMDYTKPVSLPSSVRCSSLVSIPAGGSNNYGSNQQIQFPLVQYGRLVPNSMYLTANLKFHHTTGAAGAVIHGIPALSWINRVDCFINSTSVETLNNVGSLSNMLMNGRMNASDKLGLSYPLQLNFGGDGAAGNEDCDGYTILAASGSRDVILPIATPFPNIFSNCEKTFPLSSGQCRIVVTTDALDSFVTDIAGGVSSLSAFTIDQVELHYDIIEMDAETEALVNSQTDSEGDMYLKSQSYAVSSQPIPTNFSGFIELPFAVSLTSIKSVFAVFNRSDRYKQFSAYDPTNSDGSIGFTIAGKPYPETLIDTKNHRSSAVVEFLEAIHGTKQSVDVARCSLSFNNFRNSTVNVADDSSKNLSKAYFGISTEKIDGSYLLTGISSMNSNVTVRTNINVPTNVALNCQLIVNHDVLIKINPSTRQVSVLK